MVKTSQTKHQDDILAYYIETTTQLVELSCSEVFSFVRQNYILYQQMEL